MKKTGLLIGLTALLFACQNSPDVTISEMVVGEEKLPPDTTLSEMLFGKECKNCKKTQPVVVTVDAAEDEVVEADETVYLDYAEKDVLFRLPTRSSRYMINEPAPETYAIAATRATNRMLDETGALFEESEGSFIYVKDLKKADRQLPDGVYNAARATKNIIRNSRTFKVVDKPDEADYILETVIDNAGTPEEPILVYKLILYDDGNNLAGQWTETLRRLRNDDRSWW